MKRDKATEGPCITVSTLGKPLVPVWTPQDTREGVPPAQIVSSSNLLIHNIPKSRATTLNL